MPCMNNDSEILGSSLEACPTKHLDGVDLSTLPSKVKTFGIIVAATSQSLNPTKAKQFEDAFDAL